MKTPACLHPYLRSAVLVPLLASCSVFAQTPGPAPAPPAAPAAKPITLPVTVVDKKGDPVKNLTPADLTLTDNGHIQTVQSFSIAPASPVLFGILTQTSSGLRTELGDVRLATTHFIDHTLPGTDDKAFLVQFGHEVDLLADPTTAQNKLHDAVDQIGSREFGQNGTSDTGSQDSDQTTHSGHGAGATLNDALYLAATEVMKKEPGQHVIVLISDGVDSDSKESINDAIDAAQATRTAVFAIYFKPEEAQQNRSRDTNRRGGASGPGFPGGGGGYPGGGGGYPGGGGGRRGGGGGQTPSEPQVDGKAILEHLCSATGGYMVEGRKDKADDAFAKISALLKNQYAITWTPGTEVGDTDLHHITLTTKKNDVWAIVQEDYSTK